MPLINDFRQILTVVVEEYLQRGSLKKLPTEMLSRVATDRARELVLIDDKKNTPMSRWHLYCKAVSIHKSKDPVSELASLTYHHVGAICVTNKLYEGGEKWLRQALSIREEKLGPQHPDTCATRDLLAECLRQAGQVTKAKVWKDKMPMLLETNLPSQALYKSVIEPPRVRSGLRTITQGAPMGALSLLNGFGGAK